MHLFINLPQTFLLLKRSSKMHFKKATCSNPVVRGNFDNHANFQLMVFEGFTRFGI